MECTNSYKSWTIRYANTFNHIKLINNCDKVKFEFMNHTCSKNQFGSLFFCFTGLWGRGWWDFPDLCGGR